MEKKAVTLDVTVGSCYEVVSGNDIYLDDYGGYVRRSLKRCDGRKGRKWISW